MILLIKLLAMLMSSWDLSSLSPLSSLLTATCFLALMLVYLLLLFLWPLDTAFFLLALPLDVPTTLTAIYVFALLISY